MTEISAPQETNSSTLIGLIKEFDFLINAYSKDKLPKVIMLSGKKGIGKSTMIKHFLGNVFDKINYDIKNKVLNLNTLFFTQFINKVNQNIVYLEGSSFSKVNIEDIRYLKSKIQKTNISTYKRFIILDDVEVFNTNCLNALLKTIEEPSTNNHFILINNETSPLIKTIVSRTLHLKMKLTEEERIRAIEYLLKKKNLDIFIDYKNTDLTPGNFVSFNKICFENNINFDDNFIKNIEILIKLYKKHKNKDFTNLILFLVDWYFLNQKKNNYNIERVIQEKLFILRSINDFIFLNLNQNSLINAISNKLYNE